MPRPRTRRQASARYEFHLAEPMTDTALAAFPGLSPAPTSSEGTALTGTVRDQSELYAILDRLNLVGVTLVSVQRLPD
jgi:hypothetical protein